MNADLGRIKDKNSDTVRFTCGFWLHIFWKTYGAVTHPFVISTDLHKYHLHTEMSFYTNLEMFLFMSLFKDRRFFARF